MENLPSSNYPNPANSVNTDSATTTSYSSKALADFKGQQKRAETAILVDNFINSNWVILKPIGTQITKIDELRNSVVKLLIEEGKESNTTIKMIKEFEKHFDIKVGKDLKASIELLRADADLIQANTVREEDNSENSTISIASSTKKLPSSNSSESLYSSYRSDSRGLTPSHSSENLSSDSYASFTSSSSTNSLNSSASVGNINSNTGVNTAQKKKVGDNQVKGPEIDEFFKEVGDYFKGNEGYVTTLLNVLKSKETLPPSVEDRRRSPEELPVTAPFSKINSDTPVVVKSSKSVGRTLVSKHGTAEEIGKYKMPTNIESANQSNKTEPKQPSDKKIWIAIKNKSKPKPGVTETEVERHNKIDKALEKAQSSWFNSRLDDKFLQELGITIVSPQQRVEVRKFFEKFDNNPLYKENDNRNKGDNDNLLWVDIKNLEAQPRPFTSDVFRLIGILGGADVVRIDSVRSALVQRIKAANNMR